MAAVVDHGLTPTLYTAAGVAAAAAAAAGACAPVDVHVKVDTGMHRVGADPDAVAALVTAIDHAPGLRFAALWSHLAVADGPGPDDRAFTDRQIRCFQETATALAAAGHRPPLLHMANSAGTIAYAGARFDMIRIGIALYGVAPTPALDPQRAAGGGTALHPVLSWHSRVSMVRTLDPGERPSYGRRRPLAERSLVATVPVGYADGVPRRYGADGGCVLIAGRRCPLAGTVTMDQIVVDCGPDADVAIGDDVVLIGRQGPASLAVQDWADVLGTIGNEVLTEIGSRVPRVVVDSDATGGPAGEEENR
jgi:alanine racemase